MIRKNKKKDKRREELPKAFFGASALLGAGIKGATSTIGNFADDRLDDASAGQKLGWGLADSIGLGGVLGKDKFLQDQENERMEQQQELKQADARLSEQQIREDVNIPIFRMGGQMPDKVNGMGEMAETGGVDDIKGKAHKQGGTNISNIVEAQKGETLYNDYIFSDTFKVSKKLAEEYNIPKKYVGKTISDVSKFLKKKYDKRKNDVFDETSKKEELDSLKQMQEDMKRDKASRDLKKFAKDNPEAFQNIMQQKQGQVQGQEQGRGLGQGQRQGAGLGMRQDQGSGRGQGQGVRQGAGLGIRQGQGVNPNERQQLPKMEGGGGIGDPPEASWLENLLNTMNGNNLDSLDNELEETTVMGKDPEYKDNMSIRNDPIKDVVEDPLLKGPTTYNKGEELDFSEMEEPGDVIKDSTGEYDEMMYSTTDPLPIFGGGDTQEDRLELDLDLDETGDINIERRGDGLVTSLHPPKSIGNIDDIQEELLTSSKREGAGSNNRRKKNWFNTNIDKKNPLSLVSNLGNVFDIGRGMVGMFRPDEKLERATPVRSTYSALDPQRAISDMTSRFGIGANNAGAAVSGAGANRAMGLVSREALSNAVGRVNQKYDEANSGLATKTRAANAQRRARTNEFNIQQSNKELDINDRNKANSMNRIYEGLSGIGEMSQMRRREDNKRIYDRAYLTALFEGNLEKRDGKYYYKGTDMEVKMPGAK